MAGNALEHKLPKRSAVKIKLLVVGGGGGGCDRIQCVFPYIKSYPLVSQFGF